MPIPSPAFAETADNAFMFVTLIKSSRPAWAPWGTPALMTALYLLLYVGLDRLSFIHPMRGLNITPWNPQAALAVALLMWQPSAWWLVSLGLVGGELAIWNLPQFKLADVPASAMTTLGYVLMAAGLARWIGPAPRTATRRHFLVFLLIVAMGTLLNAMLYVGTLALAGIPQPDRIAPAVLRSWIGDTAGLMVMLPLLLGLAGPERRGQSLHVLRSAEWWLIAALATLGAWAVFARPAEDQFKYFYLLLLPAAWSAARFGVVGAIWSSALIQMLLIAAVLSLPYRSPTVFELQILMVVVAGCGLLLGTIVDEREEAARTLRDSLRLAAAGDMAAALAHELNQPLSALSTYACASQLLVGQLASERPDLAGPLTDVTDRLVAEANRASAVVMRLRNFFRDRTTELQPTDLSALLNEVARTQAPRAAALGIQLTWSGDPSVPPVWLDQVQIMVVLRNLLSNAIEAASQASERWVSVRATKGSDDQAVVSVLDSGGGIGSGQLQQCFEHSPSTKPGGMGIGLSISRAILEAHGGRLWAEPGPGGKFFFSLPLSALYAANE